MPYTKKCKGSLLERMAGRKSLTTIKLLTAAHAAQALHAALHAALRAELRAALHKPHGTARTHDHKVKSLVRISPSSAGSAISGVRVLRGRAACR